MKPGLVVLLLLLLPAPPLLASQDGIVVRTAAVYAQASRGAERIGRIDAGTRVSIFSRQGGWQEIFSETDSMVGWVRTYEVRELRDDLTVPVESQEDSRGFLAGLASFSRKASRFFGRGGAATSSGTATIGVRGLSEAELKAAKPDLEEFERMRQYASNRSRATQFSRTGELKSRRVKHLKPRKSAQQDAGGRRDK